MTSFFFSTPVDIDIVLEDGDDRSTVDVKLDKNRKEKAPLYFDGESVKGAVTVRPKDGRRLEHTGIKVQFIGLIGGSWLPPSWAATDARPQKCSLTEAIIMSFCRLDKSLQRLASYSTRRRSPSTSRTLRSSMSRTTASTLGCGTLFESQCQDACKM